MTSSAASASYGSSAEAASASYGSSSASQKNGQSLGKDDFMKLLVVQLENQDPMEPMKGTDFTAQLAQFSTVEQLYNANDKLTGIQAANSNTYASQSVNMIGKQVSAIGNEINLSQAGSSTITFHLPIGVDEGTITIHDENGKPITTIKLGALSAGKHDVTWNGTSSDGTRMPEGTYTYEIKGQGKDGTEVAGVPFTRGVVSGIVYEGGQVFAKVGSSNIPLSRITEIYQNN